MAEKKNRILCQQVLSFVLIWLEKCKAETGTNKTFVTKKALEKISG